MGRSLCIFPFLLSSASIGSQMDQLEKSPWVLKAKLMQICLEISTLDKNHLPICNLATTLKPLKKRFSKKYRNIVLQNYALNVPLPFLLFLHSLTAVSANPSKDMPRKRPREPPMPFSTSLRSYMRCCSARTT